MAKFYIFILPFNRGIELYGSKGYEFFHFVWENGHFNLDGARIRYEFTECGWKEITPDQAAEVLRDMWPKWSTYIWAYEEAQKAKALAMISAAKEAK